MIEINDIEKLAGLARIAVTEEEKAKFQKDLESILNYVSELKDAPPLADFKDDEYLKNVMRADDNAYQSGGFTDEILAEVPNRSDGYFKVKKIFN